MGKVPLQPLKDFSCFDSNKPFYFSAIHAGLSENGPMKILFRQALQASGTHVLIVPHALRGNALCNAPRYVTQSIMGWITTQSVGTINRLNRTIKDNFMQFNHQTPEMVVLEASRDYIQSQKRLAALKAFGQYDFDPDYDYKAVRKR